MYTVSRFGKVLCERFLGRRDFERTREDAIGRWGKGIVLVKIL